MTATGWSEAKRRAYVIIKRWQDFTGQQATLEATGQAYADLKAERCKPAA